MKSNILIIGTVILADQLSKGLLLRMITGAWHWGGRALAIAPFPYMIARLTSWFNIVFTWNPGTAFSLLREAPGMAVIFITAAIIGFLTYHLFARIKDGREKLAMSLIVGGALGNLIDRARFGAVIDFVDWHAGTWHWPAFNVADACICAGAGLYLLIFIKQRKRNG
ncbi:MAG: signal peptidase II [Rickettsiales bacterium]|nr:signal peptidase II [Rickettsiales bacterium]